MSNVENILTAKTDIYVQLTGEDGNIFSIMGRVSKALKRAGHAGLAAEFCTAVTECHSYDNALNVVSRYVVVG